MTEETQLIINKLRTVIKGAMEISNSYEGDAIKDNDKSFLATIKALRINNTGLLKWLDKYEREHGENSSVK